MTGEQIAANLSRSVEALQMRIDLEKKREDLDAEIDGRRRRRRGGDTTDAERRVSSIKAFVALLDHKHTYELSTEDLSRLNVFRVDLDMYDSRESVF
jgi:hypothetical protein